MVEDDLENVLKIEDVSYPKPWTKQAFLEEMQKPFASAVVITDDETDQILIGYLVFWTMFEDCHILNVTVAIEWRGLGFGQKLIRHAIDVALKKGCSKIVLEVRKTNQGAIKLYQKLGFFVDQIKKGFYSDGEDAYSMMKYLEKKNEF